MGFINPKLYLAFKKIFGSNESREILMSFLNAILYAGESAIEDLEILDRDLSAEIFGSKDTYLDVKAKINDRNNVIVTMQVLNVTKFRPLLQVFLVKTLITFDRTHYGLQKILALIAG
mgnify:FL=1